MQKAFEDIEGNGKRTRITFVLTGRKKAQRVSVDTESYFKRIMKIRKNLKWRYGKILFNQLNFTSLLLIESEYSDCLNQQLPKWSPYTSASPLPGNPSILNKRLRRRPTDGQRVYEKMFSVINQPSNTDKTTMRNRLSYFKVTTIRKKEKYIKCW